MRKILMVFCCGLVFQTMAQKNEYKEMIYENDKQETMPYRVLFPHNYDAAKSYPLIFFLHGSGERGSDNKMQLVHGADLFQSKATMEKFPAIVVFPQCPAGDSWSNLSFTNQTGIRQFQFNVGGTPTSAMKLLQELLFTIIKEHKIDKNRIYVGGLSMGGMGTFELVYRNPNLFAAAFPICGGANVKTAKQLTNLSWWIFHGEQDDVVPHEFSVQMAKAIKRHGGDVKLTLYPEAGHDSWTPAFAEKELLSWLFSNEKNKAN